MTEPQIDEVVSRASQGAGVEAALKAIGISSNIGTQALKDHPTARGRLKDAKVQGTLALVALAAAKAQAELAAQAVQP